MTRLTRVVLASVGTITMAALVAAMVTLPGTTASPVSTQLDVPASANLSGVAAPSAATASGSVAAASVSAAKPAVHTVYVSAASASVTTADDVNGGITEAAARSLVASMNDYWSKESGGLVTIVFGGFETRALNYTACNSSVMFANAPTVAFNGRFKNSAWTGTLDHLLVLTTEACGSAGLGSVGGDGGIMLSGNGVTGGVSVPVATHEFGHNLGFGHAGSSICATGTQDAGVESFGAETSACPTVEYADYLDIMGYSFAGAMPHLSTPQRIRSGWMSDYTALTASAASTTSTITSLDGAAGNRALRITDPLTGANYYVEYRTASGTDATSTEFTATETCLTTGAYSNCSRGATASTGSLRILKELPYRDYTQYVRTTVLAVGSTTFGDTTRSTRLSVGDSFASANGGFYLSVNALGAAAASVTVRFTPPVATTSTLTLSSPTQVHGSKSTAATVSVATQDGSSANGTVTFFDGTSVLGYAPVSGGTATLAVASTTKAGKHALSATFTPAVGDWTASATGKAVLTVKKASSKATISKLKKSKRSVTATVKIAVTGVAAPTGKVSIYANGKKVKTYTLSAKQKGVVSVKLSLKKAGAVKLTAKYSGTANVLAKTSAVKKA